MIYIVTIIVLVCLLLCVSVLLFREKMNKPELMIWQGCEDKECIFNIDQPVNIHFSPNTCFPKGAIYKFTAKKNV